MTNIFYAPISTANGSPLDDSNRYSSLDKMVTIDFLFENLDKTNDVQHNENMEILKDLKNAKFKKLPIWGFSQKHYFEKMKENDIIFFGYRDCILYTGRIYKTFIDVKLSEKVWNTRGSWPYKILLKNLNRVYIPNSVDVYNRHPQLRKGLSESDGIIIKNKLEKLEETRGKKMASYKKILNLPNHNIQGTQYITGDPNEVKKIMEDFEDLFLKMNFRPLIKVIFNIEEFENEINSINTKN